MILANTGTEAATSADTGVAKSSAGKEKLISDSLPASEITLLNNTQLLLPVTSHSNLHSTHGFNQSAVMLAGSSPSWIWLLP